MDRTDFIRHINKLASKFTDDDLRKFKHIMIKYMSIKNNYLALNLVYIFFFTSCTVTFNSIESYPKSKSYDKPLVVISYDYYTKYLHKRLERAFRNEFENQNYDASFIRIEQANKKFEINNNQFPIYQVLKDSLPADSSDLLILIHPLV